MILAKETTVWDVEYKQPNHTYLFSDAMDKMVGYFKWGNPKDFTMFKNPIRIDTRYRKFKILQRDLKVSGEKPKNTVWKINGSKDHVYYVEKTSEDFTCTCIGYKYHGKCKHIDEVKTNLEMSL